MVHTEKKTANKRKKAEISSTSFPRSLFSASLVVEETREVEKNDPGNDLEISWRFVKSTGSIFPTMPCILGASLQHASFDTSLSL